MEQQGFLIGFAQLALVVVQHGLDGGFGNLFCDHAKHDTPFD